MHTPEPRAPRFLADAMLERLARWLRVLGFDTASGDTATDAELVRRAQEEGRVLLTRDRRLTREWSVPDTFLVVGDKPLDQLREVMAHFRLAAPQTLFTRCLLCNSDLQLAAAEGAGSPAPGAHEHSQTLRCCPSCGRVYWEGSHTRRMRAVLERALQGWEVPG
jgi:uncharacterized protein